MTPQAASSAVTSGSSALRPWLWISAVVVLADQATKYAIDRYTGPDFYRVLIPGFANLVHHRNPGVAFGLLSGSGSTWVRVFVVVIPVIALALMFWFLASRRDNSRLNRIALALLIGGTSGNLIDRIIQGEVVDFLNLHIGAYHWPTFNVADSAITIGAILFIFDMLRGKSRSAPANPPSGTGA